MTTLMNGNALQENLEDSIASLLSSSLIQEPKDDSVIINSNYKKAAKLFINKKFQQSFEIVQNQLIPQSVVFYNSGVINEDLFNNLWLLYFNLIDIFINKSFTLLSKFDKDQLLKSFKSDEFFNGFYELNKLVHPKLIVLLVLIKLNNDDTDLIALRNQMDIYLVNISSELNHVQNQDRFDSFQELLEIYHVYLLPKLNEFEESEFLIKSNHLIVNQNEMLENLHKVEKEMKDKELQKQKLAAKRAQEAQRRKEQQLKEEQELKRVQNLEKVKNKIIETNSINHNSKIVKKSQGNDLSIYNILRDKLLERFNASNSSIIVLIISLISIIAFTKNHKLLLNNRIKQFLLRFWTKLSNTLKMAFQVTYM